MDQNINSDGSIPVAAVTPSNTVYDLVAWVYGYGNRFGPVAAIDFLYNATKNWTNVPPLKYEYYDKEFLEITDDSIGYISFISNNGEASIIQATGEIIKIGTSDKPLRARLPIHLPSDETRNEVSNFDKINQTNLWLYNYLHNNSDVTGDDLQNISGVLCYWTLSSNSSDARYARIVYYNGGVNSAGTQSYEYCGVRPVITLPKTDLK